MEASRRLSIEQEIALAKEQLAREPDEEIYIPRGIDLLNASLRNIDLSAVLAGERWLSRKNGCLVIAPSGHGKSSLSIQLAILWACGRTAFGLKARQAMRILIIQAEDDDNDVTEFAQCIERMGLSEAERELVRKNTHIEWVNDVIGVRFFKRLRRILEKKGVFDLLIINPLGSYLRKDAKDAESIVEFRTHLSRLLEDFNCGALIFHHTPKTRFIEDDKFNWWDWMYVAAGDAGLVNWARGILILWPTSVEGTYRFIAGKRGDKMGWQAKEYHFSWSTQNGILLWVPSTEAQIRSAQKSKKSRDATAAKAAQVDEILALIPATSPIIQSALFEKASPNEKRVREILTHLLEQGEIIEHKVPRLNAKSAVGYTRQ